MFMKGKYFFLSNFFPCRLHDIDFPDITYMSVEAAFQAAKVTTYSERVAFSNADPSTAKRLGRRVCLRPDWELIKDSVMEHYLWKKFSSPQLAARLKAVTEPIVEDNTWGDRYWGRCNGYGHNRLGQLLEKIRAEI